MPETLLTIHEASALTDKSVQTIRRALKSKKLIAKKQKTPQGFNYMIGEDALIALYNLNREHINSGINNRKGNNISIPQDSLTIEFATKEEFNDQKKNFNTLVEENRKDKDTFMRFVKVFQERFTALENQVKLLGEPGSNKKWFQFWKK